MGCLQYIEIVSRTYRIYNKPNYFRRLQDLDYNWKCLYYPRYHPYKQYNVARWLRCEEGVTRRWLTQRRRIWYRKLLKCDLQNL